MFAKYLNITSHHFADQSALLRIARRLFKSQQTIQLLVAQYAGKSNKWSFKMVADFWRQGFALIWDSKGSMNAIPENTYIPEGFTGGVQLFYFKWGEMGFFQFGFFQRFWKKQALACPSFRLVTSGNHEKPSWHMVADIVNGYLRQAGF